MQLVVYGTRPQEIKAYPFTKHKGFKFLFVNQSPDLEQGLFEPDYRCSEHDLEAYLKFLAPKRVIVFGDTRTGMRAALYAFEQGMEVVHVESGMRTFDLKSPFPEEGYRQMMDVIATKKYCSTPESAKNCSGQYVGATPIDTLFEFCGPITKGDYAVVTVHRRENLERMPEIVREIHKYKGKLRVFAHPNQTGQELKKYFVTEPPMPYKDFVKLLAGAELIMTDSGGVEEYAIALDKPHIILREKSERKATDLYDTGATKRIVEDLCKTHSK
jgi:UDP-N-acetylglucosamine 2-epimerase (non-hydrolysing)